MAENHHHDQSGRNLGLAFFLNLFFTILEFFGGIITNSVAILSDALHDLGDSLSLGLSWYLNKKSKKSASDTFSFGYIRFSLLGALINGVVLIVGSVFIITEAIQRINAPEEADPQGMLIFALIGILVNGIAAWKLHGGKSMNEKMVSWHLWEDVLGWVAVLIVSIILMFTDWYFLDPILSLAITVFILYNVLKRLKDTLFILLQGVPRGYNLNEIKDSISTVPRVQSLHHTHLWTLDGQHHVFTTHVVLQHVSDYQEIKQIKEEIKERLRNFEFDHFTIEVELKEEKCDLR